MRSTRFGFTIIELLVVITILFILAGVGVPAVRSILRSSDRSLAVNQLRSAVAGARDAAILSGPGRDAAAVFLFEPGGRASVAIYTQVGTLDDSILEGDPAAPSPASTPYVPDQGAIFRDVFVPAPAFEAISLPGSWAVRGYAAPGVVDQFFYEDTLLQLGAEVDPNPRWLFPETDFFVDPARQDRDGDRGFLRQTFVLRFAGGTGEPVVNGGEALIVAPSPDRAFRDGDPFADNNLLAATDLGDAVERILGNPALTRRERRQLLGDEASDTILARPVAQVVLYERQALATFLGVRLDRATGSLYVDPGQTGGQPQIIPGTNLSRIPVWLENRVDPGASDFGSRLFTVTSTPGGIVEVTP